MNKVSWHPGCFDEVYAHADVSRQSGSRRDGNNPVITNSGYNELRL